MPMVMISTEQLKGAGDAYDGAAKCESCKTEIATVVVGPVGHWRLCTACWRESWAKPAMLSGYPAPNVSWVMCTYPFPQPGVRLAAFILGLAVPEVPTAEIEAANKASLEAATSGLTFKEVGP